MRIMIEIDEGKEVRVETQRTERNEEVADVLTQAETKLSEEDGERYEVASDLANCCEYLEESELIKIKLIVQKCMARKERAE